jgi:hypothetical protein
MTDVFSCILYQALEIWNYELFRKPLSVLLIITRIVVALSLETKKVYILPFSQFVW